MVEKNIVLFALWAGLATAAMHSGIVGLVIAKEARDSTALCYGIMGLWLSMAFMMSAIIRLIAPCYGCQYTMILMQRTAFMVAIVFFACGTSIMYDAHRGVRPRIYRLFRAVGMEV